MRRKWTSAEDRKLRKLYRTLSAAECAVELGRTLSATAQRANTLGLHKSPEWVADRARQRWAEGRHERSREALAIGRGWNKGIRGSTGTHANCRRTQFKPGHLGGAAADKIQPIGTLRIADGQLQKKMHNGRPFMSRWVTVQRIVWEAANGPIPPGHVVVFKDGRVRTVEAEITLDKLELISRAENMRRNSYLTRYPKEVADLIRLRGALNRKINTRERRRAEAPTP